MTIVQSSPASDSVRQAAEASLRHALDSMQRAAEAHAHAVYDSALVHSASLAVTSGQWMAVAIAALGALFALLAIVAGAIIFGQSNEFRQRTAKLFEDTDSRLQAMIADRDARATAIIDQMNGEYATLKSKFEEAVTEAAETPSEDQTAAVRNAENLESLGEQLQRMESMLRIATTPLPPAAGASFRAHDIVSQAPTNRYELRVRPGADNRNLQSHVVEKYGLDWAQFNVLKSLLTEIDPELLRDATDEVARDAFLVARSRQSAHLAPTTLRGLRSGGILDGEGELTSKGADVLRDLATHFEWIRVTHPRFSIRRT